MFVDNIKGFLLLMSRRNDVALAVLLVAIIFMMILPLPTVVIDTLIAFSLCSAAILLMTAVYLQSPLEFSTFPSVLLITTIYRLALGISTTRVILLNADAGEIIYTFGNFVVAGNLIVGAVIFLIITIVQFIVITKGSERVAEVAARFSLDAMPGKQMSIDGDMRAGVIDMNEAKRRRGLVEKESQLYGSMDGAMKFVKGDAIAGLIIIVVNIIGGISIGTLMHGMSVGEALELYSILTIGDGLVQQIPALFISITAGVIVTRVSAEDAENLGQDIGKQLGGQPKALLIASAIMFLFALIPGMPELVFIPLSIIVGAAGYFRMKAARLAAEGGGDAEGIPSMTPAAQLPGGKKEGAKEGEDFALTVPLLVDVSSSVQKSIKAGVLNSELMKLRRALYFDLGVPFPGIHLRFNDEAEPNTYSILMQEIPIVRGQLKPGFILARESKEDLTVMNIPFEEEPEFLPRTPTLWVDEKYKKNMDENEFRYLDNVQILTYHLSFVLKKYGEEFVGMQETKFLLTKMEAQFPELVKEVQRILPIQKITEILQRLISEEVSIRNLRTIVGALIEWGQKEKDTVLLTEYVRSSLKRYISFKYSIGNNILPAYLLTPDLEDTIRNAIRQTSSGSYLALEPKVTKQILDTIKTTVGDLSKSQKPPVLVTSMDIRRYVRKLIEGDLFDLPVISYQEITSDITVQPLERISIE